MYNPIARFNCRVHIQRNRTIIDENKNHINVWEHYYSCYALVGSQNKYVIEKDSGVEIHFEQTLTFQLRYCSELKNLNSTQYRIIFNDLIYNIDSIDAADNKKQTVDIRCKLEPRQIGSDGYGG
jgi:SPP1 family predicted phage head-tail adaptor